MLTRETVINLIANTTTRKGLKVKAVLDENEYEAGRKISDDELDKLNLQRDNFHPEWNYTITPHSERTVKCNIKNMV